VNRFFRPKLPTLSAPRRRKPRDPEMTEIPVRHSHSVIAATQLVAW